MPHPTHLDDLPNGERILRSPCPKCGGVLRSCDDNITGTPGGKLTGCDTCNYSSEGIDMSDYEYLPPQDMAARPTKTMLQQAMEALANALVVDPHRPSDPAWELDYARAFALMSIAEDVKAIREVAETWLEMQTPTEQVEDPTRYYYPAHLYED